MARKMALRPSHEHLLEGERSEMKSIYTVILTCVQRECVTRFSNLLLVFNLPEGEWHGEETLPEVRYGEVHNEHISKNKNLWCGSHMPRTVRIRIKAAPSSPP